VYGAKFFKFSIILGPNNFRKYENNPYKKMGKVIDYHLQLLYVQWLSCFYPFNGTNILIKTKESKGISV